MPNDTAPAQTLDTPKDIARLLNCASATVLNYHRAGIIPSVINVGRIIRFDRNAVLAALAEHSNREAAVREMA